VRQRFLQGIGGTLRFTPPQADAGGPPTSGTVTIKRASSNTDLPTPVVAAAAVIEGNDLTFVLTGANCPDPVSTSGAVTTLNTGGTGTIQPLYRAVWTYVVDGKTYVVDQLYEVRRRLLMPTLTVAELARRLPASIEELTDDATGSTLIDAIGDAWDDLLDELSAKGYEPDKIMDGDRLRSVHKALTLANLGRTWGPNWREWAKERQQEYTQALSDALSSDDWYDKDQSLTQAPGEVKTYTISCTR
jgi:hypothetical protein